MTHQSADETAPLLPAEDVARLGDVARATAERLGAAACSVALVQDEDLVYVAASGTGAEQVRGMRLPTGRGIGGFVAASGQALAVADVRLDPRHDREAAARSGYLPTSILAVPVEDEEGPVGVLTVLDRRVGADDLEVAAAAAVEVADVLASRARSEDRAAGSSDGTTALLEDLVRRLATRPAAEREAAVRLLQGVLEP